MGGVDGSLRSNLIKPSDGTLSLSATLLGRANRLVVKISIPGFPHHGLLEITTPLVNTSLQIETRHSTQMAGDFPPKRMQRGITMGRQAGQKGSQ